MKCPNCGNEIIGNFSPYKEIENYRTKIVLPMYGRCEKCDYAASWNIILNGDYSVEESLPKEFTFH